MKIVWRLFLHQQIGWFLIFDCKKTLATSPSVELALFLVGNIEICLETCSFQVGQFVSNFIRAFSRWTKMIPVLTSKKNPFRFILIQVLIHFTLSYPQQNKYIQKFVHFSVKLKKWIFKCEKSKYGNLEKTYLANIKRGPTLFNEINIKWFNPYPWILEKIQNAEPSPSVFCGEKIQSAALRRLYMSHIICNT